MSLKTKPRAPSQFVAESARPMTEPHVSYVWPVLGGLVVLAVVLRAIGLNSGLWWDEMFTLLDSIRRPVSQIVTTWSGDSNHPLYSLLAGLSRTAFGEHSWSLRLPALLFGVATVPALYLLASLVVSRREALLAAALLTVSYHHVWFSQNARGYTALAFWAVLSTYFLLRGVRDQRPAFFAAYAAAIGLGIYTHMTLVFMGVAHGLVCGTMMLVRWRRPEARIWRWAFAGLVGGAVVTLLLYAPIMSQVVNFFLHRPSGLKGVSTPRWAVLEAIRGLRIGFGANIALVLAAIVFGCGLYSLARRAPLAFFLFVLPGLVTIAGSLSTRGTLYPRYVFYTVGFGIIVLMRGALAAGAGLGGMLSRDHRAALGHKLGNGLAVGIILLSALSLLHNYRLPKQDYQGALSFVEANAKPSDRVVTAGIATFPYKRYYRMAWDSVGTVPEFRRLNASRGDLWVLYTFPMYLERSVPDLMQALRNECPTVRVFRGTVGGGDVVVCKRGNGVSPTAISD